MTQARLPVHEWLIVSLIIAIFFVLAGIAYVREGQSELPAVETPHTLYSNTLQVTIEGAVAKPGAYLLNKGAVLEDLVYLAEPLSEADLSRLKWRSKLREGQRVKVGVRQMITVFLEGAVQEEGALQVPKGTRLENLVEYVHFKPEANIKILQRKRLLKDQEKIFVPFSGEKPVKKSAKSKKERQEEIALEEPHKAKRKKKNQKSSEN